jgi:hypothetical protein
MVLFVVKLSALSSRYLSARIWFQVAAKISFRSHVADNAVAANLYNDFIVCLRTEAVRRGVRKTLADARANLRDQAVSVGRYLGELTNQYKHLVPIRVDLYYQQDAFDASDAMLRVA